MNLFVTWNVSLIFRSAFLLFLARKKDIQADAFTINVTDYYKFRSIFSATYSPPAFQLSLILHNPFCEILHAKTVTFCYLHFINLSMNLNPQNKKSPIHKGLGFVHIIRFRFLSILSPMHNIEYMFAFVKTHLGKLQLHHLLFS